MYLCHICLEKTKNKGKDGLRREKIRKMKKNEKFSKKNLVVTILLPIFVAERKNVA